MKLERDYNNIFKKILKINSHKLNKNIQMYDEKKWDSLRHLTLISEIENFFDIKLSSTEILKFNSYKIGVDIVKKKLSKNI